jgi:transposase
MTLLSFFEHLLPSSTALHLEDVTLDDRQQFIVTVTAVQETAHCPRCAQPSARVHSRYTRTVADLPWADSPVQLLLHVRKFVCTTPDCPRRIFTERLPAVLTPWARRTTRLADHQRQIGLALGGAAGERLGATLDQAAGRTTLLHLVRTSPSITAPTPRILSIDDFALRKGQRYASILVDLERGVVIDLLPDRTAETFAQWLRDHPGVEVISRDRAGSYAEGATQGAPNAVQVADRWHILKNLGDALTDVLTTHQEAIAQVLCTTAADCIAPATEGAFGVSDSLSADTPFSEHASSTGADQVSVDDPTLVVGQPAHASPASRRQAVQEQRRAQRLARYEAVVQLHQAGWTISAIGDEIGLDRTTVRKYLTAPTFPERQPGIRRRSTLLDPFKPYILERWNAGCHTAMQMVRELEQRGYRGGRTSVLAFVTQLRKASGLPPKKRLGRTSGPITDPTRQRPTPRRLTRLILRKGEDQDEASQQQVAHIGQACREVETAISLAQEFAVIIRQRQSDTLEDWLERAAQSDVPALVSFAGGLRRDEAAVKAAVRLPWSNGPTEGHINRLKLLKRQSYGRAKLDLLRQRVLAA